MLWEGHQSISGHRYGYMYLYNMLSLATRSMSCTSSTVSTPEADGFPVAFSPTATTWTHKLSMVDSKMGAPDRLCEIFSRNLLWISGVVPVAWVLDLYEYLRQHDTYASARR